MAILIGRGLDLRRKAVKEKAKEAEGARERRPWRARREETEEDLEE